MSGRMILRRLLAFAVFGLVSVVAASGQTTERRVSIRKIDPPNWWVEMPAPMLLVRGEGLSGARFSLSDPGLRIAKTVVSDNGHWAQLWLTKTAVRPEMVTIRASRGGGECRGEVQLWCAEAGECRVRRVLVGGCDVPDHDGQIR